jgi:hypothetical protein
MIRLSSNTTLFYKLVLPIFFTVLYGLFSIFLLVADGAPFGDYNWVRYTNFTFYVAMVFIFYKSVVQLIRVDCGPEYFVVTNYRKAFRYSYDSISAFKIENLLLFSIGIMEFKSPSHFGESIVFLLDKKNLLKIQETFKVDVFID